MRLDFSSWTTREALLLPTVAVFLLACQGSPEARRTKFLEDGKKRLHQKDYVVAILQLKNAARAMPTDAEPFYHLGLAYLATHDVKAAAACFRKATELNPRHTGAQFELAQLMSVSRDKELVEEAEKRARAIVDLQPDDAEFLSLLALAELRLGKSETAEAHLEHALRTSPRHLKSSITLARSRLARGDVAGAEEALNQASAQAPNSPDPAVYLGEFYLALGKPAQAEQQFRRALQIDGGHGPALLALGTMQARAGRRDDAEQTYKRLSVLPDQRFKSIHALFLFESGRRDEALAELKALAEADPGDREIRTRLVAAYMATGQIAEAKAALTAALKKNPRDVDALLQRSRIHLTATRYAEAEADLNQVLVFRKNSAEAHYLFSKLHQARGETASQKKELGEALRLEPAFMPARLALARAWIASRAPASALRVLDEAPESQRGTVPILLQRNWALLSLGDTSEARKGIDLVLSKAGRLPEALLQDAAFKMHQKDHSGARTSAEEMLRQNPEDTRALRLFFESYAAQKQMPTGLQRLRAHASAHPESAVVHHFLGQMLRASGDRVEARRAFETAKAHRPGWVAATLSLVELDISEGKVDSARSTLEALVSSSPTNVAARLLWAELEATDGDDRAAVEHYRRVLELDSRNAAALNNLAYVLAEHGEPDEALKYAQQAKEIAPDSATVDDTIGWTYFRKGIYSLAVKHLESAVAKDGTARRRYHLGMAYIKAGDSQRGQAIVTAALKDDPALAEREVVRQRSKHAAK